MNNTKEKKCIDLVADKFAEQEQTYKDAHQFLEEYDDATEGEQIALKVIDKHNGNYFQEYEDIFDYVNQTALSWDYIEPYTFKKFYIFKNEKICYLQSYYDSERKKPYCKKLMRYKYIDRSKFLFNHSPEYTNHGESIYFHENGKILSSSSATETEFLLAVDFILALLFNRIS